MKQKLLFLTLIAALFCACKEQNDPTNDTNKNGTIEQQPKAKFTYSINDLDVIFINQSQYAQTYFWDFGDGSTSLETSPQKRYSKAGTYKITLKATNIQKSDTYSQTITIENKKDVDCYIIGYKLYSIPYENRYYMMDCYAKGEDFDFYFYTVYSPLLANSDIPYTRYFSEPVLLEDMQEFSYYTFSVFHSKSKDDDGTQCLKQIIIKSDILDKQKSEYVLTSDNGQTKIGILMKYE